MGSAEAELARWLDRLAPALAGAAGGLSRPPPAACCASPRRRADLADGRGGARAGSREGADTIVFFGIGGSSLGGQTLAQLGGWNIPGMATPAQRRRPRTRFYDNLDAVTLQAALGSFDLAAHALRRHLQVGRHAGDAGAGARRTRRRQGRRARGARMPTLFLGITEPAVAGKANGLRALFEAHGIPMLDHHPGIGGRFSVLTNVGLIAGAWRAGSMPRAVRAGAEAWSMRCWRPSAARLRAGRGRGDRRRPGARARHPGAGDDALRRPARPVRRTGSRSCGRRASARTGRAPRPSPASGRSTSTASCSSSWTGRAST